MENLQIILLKILIIIKIEIAYLLSKKDKGVYFAMNKYNNIAKNSFFLFVNFGD